MLFLIAFLTRGALWEIKSPLQHQEVKPAGVSAAATTRREWGRKLGEEFMFLHSCLYLLYAINAEAVKRANDLIFTRRMSSKKLQQTHTHYQKRPITYFSWYFRTWAGWLAYYNAFCIFKSKYGTLYFKSLSNRVAIKNFKFSPE
jgi:hypothetical protein